MTSPDAEIRTMLQTLSLGAPVYDRVPETQAYQYVHISDISNADMFTADQTIWDVELLLDIVTNFDSIQGGRKGADTIGNEVLTALCDTPYRDLGTYVIAKTTLLSSNYIDEQTESGFIVRKLMRLSMIIELESVVVVPDPDPEPSPPTILEIFTGSTTDIVALFSKSINPDTSLSNFVLRVDGVVKNITHSEFPSEDHPVLEMITDYEMLFGEVITLEITAGLQATDGTIFAGGTFNVTNNIEEQIPDPIEGAPVINVQYATWLDFNFRFMGQAVINPNGAATTVRIEYGATTAYEETDIVLTPIASGVLDVPVFGVLNRLTPGIYHYRFVAENSAGITTGSDRTFEVYTGTNRFRTEYTYPVFNSNHYYIDPAVAPGGVGSEVDPFKTYPASMGNGYTYLQKAGTTATFTGAFSSLGSCEIGRYGTGADPVIRCAQTNSDDGFKFMEIDSLVYIHGVKIEKSDITGLGIYIITGAENSFISHIETDGWRYPVYTEASDYSTQWEDLSIVYNHIHHCGFDGIMNRYCSDAEMAHNHIHDVNLQFNIAGQEDQADSPGDCIQCNSGGTQVVNIHHNTLDHSSTGNKFGVLIASANVLGSIHHNHILCINSIEDHPVSGIYIFPPAGAVNIYNNLIENPTYGLYSYADGAKFNYNIVLNAVVGVTVLNNHSCEINNNLFINYSQAGVIKTTNASLVSHNNVFKSTANAYNISPGGTVQISHDHFDGCSGWD